MSFAVIVPTLNAGEAWGECVSAIKSQSVEPDLVLIIDSESNDQTLEIAENAGFKIIHISKHDFNHGKTRQLAVEMLSDYEFLIFLTQDALPANTDAFVNILQGFEDEKVSAANGRQLPRAGSGAVEAHARLYNYPPQSHVRQITDVSKYGLKAAFLSNSFSAYRREALLDVGGFPEDVIFGEDMYIATKFLKAGYKIAYAADASVYHSHSYSLLQEFRRYFDMGVFHAREPWLRQEFGTAESEGLKFVTSEIKYLSRHAFWRIPEGMLRTLLRYAGFRLGLAEQHIPLKIKRKISMNPGYFKID